jgi:hypothetical protein
MNTKITNAYAEKFIPKLEEENLLEKGNVADLLLHIEDTNPVLFIKRMVILAKPNEEFNGKKISEVEDINDIPLNIFCDLIDQIKIENGIGKSIRLRPNKTIKVVEGNSGNGLLRDLFGYYDSPTSQRAPQIRYRGEKLDYSDQKLRDTIFAFGFILNLTKDQFLKLLLQECSLANINYKDPYEVLYMYSITKHTNTYESYLKLCKQYETALKNQSTNDSSIQKAKRTAVYKRDFEDQFESCISVVDENTENKLIDFVVSLPKTDSVSFNETFLELYESIADAEITKKISDKFSEKDLSDDDTFSVFADVVKIAIENRSKNVCKYVEDDELLNQIFGNSKARSLKGTISKILKKRALITPELVAGIKSGERNATRDHIVILAFYKFMIGLDDKFSYWDVLTRYDFDKQKALKPMYVEFKNYCDGILDKIGSAGLYLPNTIERVVVFCLLTSNPLNTFHYLMKAGTKS